MKTYNKTSLPDCIEYNGQTYKRNERLTIEIQLNGRIKNAIIEELKKDKIKIVLVNVLHKNLKGKTDLHGQPYQSTKWIFTNN